MTLREQVSQMLTTGILGTSVAAFVAIWFLMTGVHDETFRAHRYCLVDKSIINAFVMSDLVIALSYVAISVCLIWLVAATQNSRPKWFSGWMITSFAIFIVACGGTHLANVITMYIPVYRLDVNVRIVCAVSSLTTASVLIPVMRNVRDAIKRDYAAQNHATH